MFSSAGARNTMSGPYLVADHIELAADIQWLLSPQERARFQRKADDLHHHNQNKTSERGVSKVSKAKDCAESKLRRSVSKVFRSISVISTSTSTSTRRPGVVLSSNVPQMYGFYCVPVDQAQRYDSIKYRGFLYDDEEDE